MTSTPAAGGNRPLTRSEVLQGLGARRAAMALFAVESRTGYLALRARHAAAPALCEARVRARERAFLAAVSAGRTLPSRPSVQELERFAPHWRSLLPRDADVRADVARLLGTRYRFRRGDVPRLRAAVGLDDEDVRRAFLRRHDRPPDAVYAGRLPVRDRARWAWSRVARWLEELPPFWTAYALTLTQTVGAGVLALPIALAGLGPVPGVALVVVLGLVNVLTAAAVAETFARTGEVRWGGAFFGGVVRGYLGPASAATVAGALALFSLVVLLAYSIGLATTMSAAVGLPPAVWASALLAVTLLLLRRGRADATIASALVVGAVNLAAIAALTALSLPRVDLDRLVRVGAMVAGGGVDSSVVGLVFGVVLIAFFGHTSVGSGARVVLARDPTGGALVGGTAAAMATAVVLYATWVLAVGGAVDAGRLASEPGTAIVPLAEVAGAGVLVVGTVFAVLAMGMASVSFSLGLTDLVHELLPRGRLGDLVALAPLLAVSAAAVLLLVTGRESFTGSLGLVGGVTAPLLAGVFPVLLLLSSRRRGSYVPRRSLRRTAAPVVLGAVYLVFLAALLAHGTVIWQSVPQRAAAFAAAAVAVAVGVRALRSGALVPLATVEVRRTLETQQLSLHVTAAGRAVVEDSTLDDGSAEVGVDLDEGVADELRVRVHEVDGAGRSQPLPALTRVVPASGEPAPLPADAGPVPLRGAVRVLVRLLPGGVPEQRDR